MRKVSVAVISYNQREFLADCLDSVLSQDFDDFEIVVADDGSTDGSPELLETYAAAHPGRFVLRLSKVNLGISANNNAAHFACSGEYIAWMGGDDLMLPGKLRRQVEVMESDSSIALCYHDLEAFQSDTGEVLYRFSDKNKPREGGVRELISYGTFNGGSSSMVRRSATPSYGHDTRIMHASDWLHWIETVARGGRIVYINEVLGRYRRHRKNVTSSSPEFVRSLIEDHLITCVILLRKMPYYAPETLHSFARNLVALGRRTDGNGRWPILIGAGMAFCAFLVTQPFAAIIRAMPRRIRVVNAERESRK